MSIVIEPTALRAAEGELLHHHNVIDSSAGRAFSPDTGGTTDLTADGIAALLTRACEVADLLQGLADGLDDATEWAAAADGSASALLVAIGEAVAS